MEHVSKFLVTKTDYRQPSYCRVKEMFLSLTQIGEMIYRFIASSKWRNIAIENYVDDDYVLISLRGRYYYDDDVVYRIDGIGDITDYLPYIAVKSDKVEINTYEFRY